MNAKCFVLAALASALGLDHSLADSSIATGREFAYGANLGWTNWKYDPATPEGAVVGLYNLQGRLYAANVGWISLGDGAPNNGIQYAQTNGEWGVNHDGTGGLTGFAYGANVGWILFDQNWTRPPRVDLATGAMSGYAYGANVGWISLDGLATTIDCGPDSDNDGIADGWEYEMLAGAGHPADLSILGAASDVDADRRSDHEEFLADSDPFDPASWFQAHVTGVDSVAGTVDLEWPASSRRVYDTFSGDDLVTWTLRASNLIGSSWTDGPGLLPTRRFYRVGVRIPLK